MTYSLPLRRTNLQSLHILRTEARTFMVLPPLDLLVKCIIEGQKRLWQFRVETRYTLIVRCISGVSSMKLYKLLLAAVLLAALPLLAQAQSAELTLMRWPEANLEFEYPAEWSLIGEDGFEFILVDAEGNFVGLQMGQIDGSLEALFAGFAENSTGNEVEEIELEGSTALTLKIPTDSNGRDGRLVGYTVENNTVALLILVGKPEWQTLSDSLLSSIVITPVELDEAVLNEAFATSLEADQILRVGSSDAPVKMVEVLDFSCPHCVDYAGNVKRIIQKYVNSGDVQIEFRIVTFIGQERSEVVTHAQYCAAEQGLGWSMHEGIFAGYNSEGGAYYSEENMIVLAEELGADTERFTACVQDKKYADVIEQNAEVAEELGVTSTPSLLFTTGEATPQFLTSPNGEAWRGGIQLHFLYQEIDKLLES
ncbi:MAG: thioredoxin domain-containing protein [Anaerolineae bacterium]|nr:MAG: thioredoxin domain-containing protein [Anaerolineae bacterium]